MEILSLLHIFVCTDQQRSWQKILWACRTTLEKSLCPCTSTLTFPGEWWNVALRHCFLLNILRKFHSMDHQDHVGKRTWKLLGFTNGRLSKFLEWVYHLLVISLPNAIKILWTHQDIHSCSLSLMSWEQGENPWGHIKLFYGCECFVLCWHAQYMQLLSNHKKTASLIPQVFWGTKMGLLRSLAFFLGLPVFCFFSFPFAFTIIHGSGKAVKNRVSLLL